MQHLNDFTLFEDGFKNPSERFTLSRGEIEQLPSFIKMKKYQQAMLKLAPKINWSGEDYFYYDHALPVIWEDNPASEKRGNRSFKLATASYPFRINPSSGNISFGTEIVNKNFHIDLGSSESWDKAVYEIGLYSISRYFGVTVASVKNLENNPKKILQFLQSGELGVRSGSGKVPSPEAAMLSLEYVIGSKDKIKSLLIDSLKRDGLKLAKLIFDVPILDFWEILGMAGYPEDEIKSLRSSYELGIL